MHDRMGFYADHIFPRLMDWSLRGPQHQVEREKALQSVRGEVLEVGFGTGLNLRHYPPGVTRLTAIDVANMLQVRVARRIAAVPFSVTRAALSGEKLPFPDGQFDCVVTTLTLCSIADPVAALREMRRVLKAQGTYVFLEHGRSDDARVARRQDFFNPSSGGWRAAATSTAGSTRSTYRPPTATRWSPTSRSSIRSPTP